MTDLATAPPCPICRSTDLSVVPWMDGEIEYDGIECNRCLCMAPASVWLNRMEIQNGADIRFFHPAQMRGVA